MARAEDRGNMIKKDKQTGRPEVTNDGPNHVVLTSELTDVSANQTPNVQFNLARPDACR